MRKKILGTLTALMVAGGLATAGSASAGLIGTTGAGAWSSTSVEVSHLCKTVFVTAVTTPKLKLTVGKDTVEVDVNGVAYNSVKVCVNGDAAVLAKLIVVLDAPKLAPGPIVTISGYVRAIAAVTGNVTVSVEVGGLGVCKSVSTPLIPVGADFSEPIFIAAGDP